MIGCVGLLANALLGGNADIAQANAKCKVAHVQICENSANGSSRNTDGQKINGTNSAWATAGLVDLLLSRQDFLLAWSEACQSGLIGHDDVAPFVLSLLCEVDKLATASGLRP